jgi:hypothetical protein
MGCSRHHRFRASGLFWRNVRTHTLHDPVDYKIRELGEWALNQKIPKTDLLLRTEKKVISSRELSSDR